VFFEKSGSANEMAKMCKAALFWRRAAHFSRGACYAARQQLLSALLFLLQRCCFHSKGLKRQEIYTTAPGELGLLFLFLLLSFLGRLLFCLVSVTAIKLRKQCADDEEDFMQKRADKTEYNSRSQIYLHTHSPAFHIYLRPLSTHSQVKREKERRAARELLLD